jgi:hypothetical protein
VKTRTWIIAGLAASVVLIVAAVSIGQLPGGTTKSTVGQSSSEETGSTAAPTPNASPPSAPLPADPPITPTPKKKSDPGKRTTTEVEQPTSKAVAALPPSTPLLTPVVAPLPSTASAVGSIVKGFPTRVIPLVPDSIVKNSSVASQGKHLQVSLVAKSSRAAPDLLVFYRDVLAKYGMYDSPAPSLGGTTAIAFHRGTSLVTIAVTPIVGGTEYVVYGVFTAAG